jgi:hypothetical protein
MVKSMIKLMMMKKIHPKREGRDWDLSTVSPTMKIT